MSAELSLDLTQEQQQSRRTGRPVHRKPATFLTTGQAARVCGVAPRTLSKWCDSGLLKHHRIPSSQDRRVNPAELRAFLLEHQMPTADLDALMQAGWRVLLVTGDLWLAGETQTAVGAARDAEARHAATIFEAGQIAAMWAPHVFVIDSGLGRHEALHLGESLSRSQAHHMAKRVLIVGEDEADEQPGWDEVFKRPFDPGLLGAVVVGSRFRSGA